MFAVISDIHSNIEALTAVLEDIDTFEVEEILCLGDVVGYGPNPRETLKMVKRCRFTLLGNHEEALLFTPEDFKQRARRALEWTRSELSPERCSRDESYAFWEDLDGFARECVEGDFHFVHGSPRGPTREYVLPADALDRPKMGEIFESAKARISFGGHTHVPGIFVQGGLFRYQGDLPARCPLPEKKCLINVGSVGQPRDGNNRACYLLVDGDHFLWRRVPYDFETTMKKIQAIPELDDFLATRLKGGK